MRFGVHIRIAQGLEKALDRAEALGCESVQVFSGNPNAWSRKPLDPEAAAVFVARWAELDIRPIVLHTPYLVNLASPDDGIWVKSTQALADAVVRAHLLNASYVVTHIGSHKGAGYAEGVARVCAAVRTALEAAPEPVVALELGSGAGHAVGSRFEEIADIIEGIPDIQSRVGICIDAAHLWGAGYNISTPKGVEHMFGELARCAGLDKLQVIHLNDTLVELGCHRDRHHHIGRGRIGLDGFRALVNHPAAAGLPGIIETPDHSMERDAENLAALRALVQE